jgi:hypothetical protein
MLPAAAAALLLAPALAAAADVPLARSTQPMVEVANGEQTYRYEKGIAPDDVGAVAAYLRHIGESRPEIVRVPGRKGTFLAADFCGATGESLGRCLLLLQVQPAGVRELARTLGPEVYTLRPVLFVGGGRTVVLAELAAEYTKGVRVYEIEGTALRELGTIDAGVPADLGETDPTPFAKVRAEGGRLVIRFDKDLVLGTGREGAPVAKKPVVFRQQGDGFALDAPGKAHRGR